MTLDESQFDKLASGVIDSIAEVIDEALGDKIDVDVQGGILTLTLPGKAQYIINKHGPNREIWLSSPASGAAHFGYDGAKWVSTRDSSVILHELLIKEMADKFGETLAL